MKVELAKLQPNPYRDFLVDPLEEDAAAPLYQSIADTGFWGGVPVRKTEDGELQIGAGHKRIFAAINAGIQFHDLMVKTYTDEEMIRIYATENLTQRGSNAGLAMTGAVAAAVRYIAKGVLKNDPTFGQYYPKVNGFESVRGNITSEKGLGHDVVLRFFKGISAMNDTLVKEHLAQLKASGDYARIVKEVNDEIAEEQKAERDELDRLEQEAEAAKRKAEEAVKGEVKQAKAEAKKAEAKVKEKEKVKETKEAAEKAAEAAAKKPVTFDLQGVGKWLKTQTQLRTFRKVLARESIRQNVPVKAQADLAARLVQHANELNGGKLTAEFISTYLTHLLQNRRRSEPQLSAEQVKRIDHENAQVKFTDLGHHFCRNIGSAFRDVHEMIALKDEYRDLEFTVTNELRNTVGAAYSRLKTLTEKLNIR